MTPEPESELVSVNLQLSVIKRSYNNYGIVMKRNNSVIDSSLYTVSMPSGTGSDNARGTVKVTIDAYETDTVSVHWADNDDLVSVSTANDYQPNPCLVSVVTEFPHDGTVRWHQS